MSLCINPFCSQSENPDSLLFCGGCGSELLLQGRYKVVRFLGGGGFGKTYEIKERDAGLKVLKVLHNNHPKAVELFQQEAEVLSILNHPGIPQVEEDGYFIYHPHNSSEPLHCLVMEKIEGMDLYGYIKQRRYQPIDEKMALQWLQELTCILQQVHHQNFFHRDIKPANIMLRADGGLVLIDFGTARVVTDTYWEAQAEGKVTGIISAGYTPPEQMNGQAIKQSDFFALGRTFVYLLTAKDPNQFYNPMTDELIWRDQVSNLSPEFADFLDCMMMRSPVLRPKNTSEILHRLSEIRPNSSLPTKSLRLKNYNKEEFTTKQPDAGNSFNNSPDNNKQNISNQIPLTSSSSSTANNTGFFYRWMVSNIVGISLGLVLRNIFSGLVYAVFTSRVGFRYAILAAIITWLPVEILRWLLLRKRVQFNLWSFIEILFGSIVGLFLGTVTGRLIFNSGGQSVGSFLGIMGGTSITQWLTIYRQVQKVKSTLLWFIFSLTGICISILLAFFIGLFAYFLLEDFWVRGTVLTVVYAIGVFITTFLSSFTTGIGLSRLLRDR